MKPANSTVLKLVAVTVSVALVGVYVGYRVLRADAREPVAAPAPPEPPATRTSFFLEDGSAVPHMGGSKSMVVIDVEDVDPPPEAPVVPPGSASPAPDAPRK
jgi:hypothetical protein